MTKNPATIENNFKKLAIIKKIERKGNLSLQTSVKGSEQTDNLSYCYTLYLPVVSHQNFIEYLAVVYF